MNLGVFEFDYDLSWFAFFLDADERVYGRYGGRGEGAADGHLSLKSLGHAMRSALATHRRGEPPKVPSAPRRTAEQFPAAARLRSQACIHCHYVWDFRREELQAASRWSRDEIWVYPPPESVGLSLSDDRGDVVTAVAKGSAAERSGLRAGDQIQSIDGRSISSRADVQFALHHAPREGEATVHWTRNSAELRGVFALAAGWRESDISWRPSMWGLAPAASLAGRDLSPEDKAELGLPRDRMAFRHTRALTESARHAGIKDGDIILGFEGREWTTTAAQFNAFVRLNYAPGDRVSVTILRDGKRLALPMVLPK